MRRKLIFGGAGLLVVAAITIAVVLPGMMVRRTIARLAAGDEQAADALVQTLEARPVDDPRRAAMMAEIVDAYPGFSPAGQRVALRLVEVGGARELVRAGLQAADPTACELAVLHAMRPEVNLAAEVVPLLRDERIEVRRAALLALGPARDLAGDEMILPLLHDRDADLAGLAEAVLRGRGLDDRQLRLGRLMSDPAPLKRLELIQHLPADREVDPKVWLQRLSEDPSPIVRAGAARAALDPATGLGVDLRDRVQQMAQHDPDGTVRQIAEYLIRAQPGPTK